MTISREGNFTRSGRDDLDEIQIFKGDENTLTMRQTYTHKFQCVYILNRYPFDTQVRVRAHQSIIVFQECWIEMVVGALDLKTVTLRPDLLWMEQPLDMTQFRITHQVTIFTPA